MSETNGHPYKLTQTLIELAELYFAMPPPRAQQQNPLGDMISAMFGGGGAPGGAAPARRTLAPAAPTSSLGLD